MTENCGLRARVNESTDLDIHLVSDYGKLTAKNDVLNICVQADVGLVARWTVDGSILYIRAYSCM